MEEFLGVRAGQTDGKLTRDAFAYDRARDCFVCPEGHDLILRSITSETGVKRYLPTASACRHCPRKPDCTDGSTRTKNSYSPPPPRTSSAW